MRLATHTPGAPQGAAIGRHSRAFSLAPAALLVVCIFGFAWAQITADVTLSGTRASIDPRPITRIRRSIQVQPANIRL